MKRPPFLPRTFVLLLTLAIALPNPAFALRQLAPPEDSRRLNQIRAGLEESGDSNKKGELDKIGQQALQFLLNRRRQRASRRRQISQGAQSAPEEHRPSAPWFNPRDWADFLKGPVLSGLKKEGIVRVPLSGGEAVLLFRQNWAVSSYSLIDMILKPPHGPALYAGRIDFFYGPPKYIAAGVRGTTGLPSFSLSAERYLEEEGIALGSAGNPFQKYRSGELSLKALHVSDEAVKATNLPQATLEDMIALVGASFLNFLGHNTFVTDPQNPRLNSFLMKLVKDSQPDRNPMRFSAPYANVQAVLKTRLSMPVSAAGLEEREWPGLVQPLEMNIILHKLAEVIMSDRKNLKFVQNKTGQEVLDFLQSQWKEQNGWPETRISREKWDFVFERLLYLMRGNAGKRTLLVLSGPAFAFRLSFLADSTRIIAEEKQFPPETDRGVVFRRVLIRLTVDPETGDYYDHPKGLSPKMQREMLDRLLEVLGFQKAGSFAGYSGNRVSTAGLEERIALRFRPDGAVAFERETGPLSAPGRGVQLIVPPPPTPIGAPNKTLAGNLKILRGMLSSTYQTLLSSGKPADIRPIKTHIINTMHRGFQQSAIPDAVSEREFQQFLTFLDWNYFMRIGETHGLFATPQKDVFPVRFKLEGPWKRVSYLEDRASVWVAEAKRLEGPDEVLGSTEFDAARVDSKASKKQAEEWYQAVKRAKPTMDIVAELQRILPAIHANRIQFPYYFGSRRTWQEQVRHAKDAAWAFLFYGKDLRFHPWMEVLATEALIRPGSHLDRTVWTPEKTSQVFDKHRALFKLGGQTGAVLEIMDELLDNGWDDWAYAMFLRHLIELEESSPIIAAGYGGDAEGYTYDYFRRNGFKTSAQLIRSLNEADPQGRTTPGRNAFELLEGFYKGNFLTDQVRKQLLDGNPAAGLEESKDAGRRSKLRVELERAAGGTMTLGPEEGLTFSVEGGRQQEVLPDELARRVPLDGTTTYLVDLRQHRSLVGIRLLDWVGIPAGAVPLGVERVRLTQMREQEIQAAFARVNPGDILFINEAESVDRIPAEARAKLTIIRISAWAAETLTLQKVEALIRAAEQASGRNLRAREVTLTRLGEDGRYSLAVVTGT